MPAKDKEIRTLSEFGKVTLKEKFFYFFGEFGSQSVFYYLVLTYSVFFYTDVMHLSATTVGVIVIVSRCCDALTDLVIGSLVDRTKSKFGKARFWCLIMTAPYAISMLLIYCVPAGWASTHQWIYIVITYNLATSICYTFENIPWGTLSTLISRDKVQRSQLSSLRMVGSPLAGAVGVSIALSLVTVFGGDQSAWIKSMAIFAVVGILINLLCIFNIKERVKDVVTPEKSKHDIPSVLRNKYWWFCIIIIGLYNAFVTCFATFLPYYSTYALNNTMYTTMINNAQMVTLAATALFVVWLCRKADTLLIIRAGMVISVIGSIIGIAAPLNLPVLMVSAVIRSFGMGLLAALIHSLVGDAVEYGYWRTGHRAPGTTYSSQGLGNKVGVLLGSGLCPIILGMAGYDGAEEVQSAAAMNVISAVYLWLPLVFSAIILVVMLFYRLNQSNYNKIVNELNNGVFHPHAVYVDDEVIAAAKAAGAAMKESSGS